jgi:uncharacterized membrane protein
MQNTNPRYFLATTLILCCSLTAEFARAQSVADLDPGQATVVSTPLGKNELGDAVGIAFVAGFDDPQAVLFPDGADAIVLPNLPGDDASTAYDISEAGDVVGESIGLTETQPGFWTVAPHAVVWQGAVPITVESLVPGGTGYDLRQAVAINEKGQIAVQGRHPDSGGLHGFLYEAGAITPLGHLNPALPFTETFDMNEQGQAVGGSFSFAGFRVAFIWDGGVMSSLHDTSQIPGTVSAAHAINESGTIVGEADFTPGFSQFFTAAVWDNGVVTNLGGLEPGATSLAMDVNDHGTVVGFSASSQGDRAFIREGDGGLQDLNDRLAPGSGWILLSAQCVSNDGRIWGEGVFAGKNRPYVLVPDCFGDFVVYGASSTGADDFAPKLWGQGCLDAGEEFSLAITNGVGGAPGWLLFGTGTGVLTIAPGLDLAILPVTPALIPLSLQGSGAGAGTWQLAMTTPAGLPGIQLNVQAVLLDLSTPSGISATNAMAMLFP